MAAVNPFNLKKDELLIFLTGRCKHHHYYYEHPACFLKELGKEPRRGFLDIEASNLHADFGIVLSYAIKVEGKRKIYYGVITKEELTNGTLDKRIVNDCVRDMMKFDEIVTYNGCLTPGHRVLTADLRWVPVEALRPGDKLLAFEENSPSTNTRRHFIESKVVTNIPIEKDVYKITLSDGSILKATSDHPWLVKDNNNRWKWITTKELASGRYKSLTRIMPTWKEDVSYSAGYIGAFLDGEGNINQAIRGRSGKEADAVFSITFSQKDKTIIRKLSEMLDELGIKYSIGPYDKQHPYMDCIRIKGSREEKLKLLGITRPAKLSRLNIRRLGAIREYESIAIDKIECLGKKVVCGLETTSRTYIAEGFPCHNTRFDIPFLRSRALYWNIDFPLYGYIKHKDVYYMVKNRLRIHRNRLEDACRLLGIKGKTHLDGTQWVKALTGDKRALSYVLDHNKKDVIILEKLYHKLKDYVKEVNRSI